MRKGRRIAKKKKKKEKENTLQLKGILFRI